MPQAVPVGTGDTMVLSPRAGFLTRVLFPSDSYKLLAWFDFISKVFKCFYHTTNPAQINLFNGVIPKTTQVKDRNRAPKPGTPTLAPKQNTDQTELGQEFLEAAQSVVTHCFAFA